MEQLRLKLPDQNNKIVIYTMMDETRRDRFDLIIKNNNVQEILENFPRILDYGGDLVKIIKMFPKIYSCEHV